jgi:outer membrane protein
MSNGANSIRLCTRDLILSFFLSLSIILIPLTCRSQDISNSEILTLKQAIEIALKNQPQIEAQRGQVQVGKAKVGQVKGNYYPHFTLGSAYAKIYPVTNETSANTSLAGLPPGGNIPTGISNNAEPYKQYSAIGNINQLLCDFGKTTAQVNAQTSTTESAGYDLQFVREDVIYNVKEAYYSLLNALRTRDAATDAVDQFKKHLEYARNQFEIGSKPKFDVSKAEVDLSNAEVDLIKAENGVSLYRMSLDSAIDRKSVV